MRIPGNIWAEVWEAAKRNPAHKQKRLFDDTKEAEKVLYISHFMIFGHFDYVTNNDR